MNLRDDVTHVTPQTKGLFKKMQSGQLSLLDILKHDDNDNFNPTRRFAVCSDHFETSCFNRQAHFQGLVRRLVTGSIPTIWKKTTEVEMAGRYVSVKTNIAM